MVVDRPESVDPVTEPFVLPPESRPLRTSDWIERWPSVSPELVKKYGWYVANFYGMEFLVMTIFRSGKVIFYAARTLDERYTRKYYYPPGRKREYWISDDYIFTPRVFFTEGVADAVVLSPYGTSVALLGSNYDGSLDAQLKGCTVILAMDGDVAGVCGAVRIAKKLPCASVIYTIPGKDPTNWTQEEIEGACQ
jgi:DNA primase